MPLAPAAVVLLCKTFTKLAGTVSVSNLSVLEAALSSKQRENGQGIITVANHISTLDDPLAWGALPLRCNLNLLSKRNTRWTLGASELMFTNPIYSAFFRSGHVIETFRGKGIYQSAVDEAIAKLNSGDWVHLFSEGRINQPNKLGQLRRFKWGIGRMVMEAAHPPVIIPMWLSGFEQVMPEGRTFPYNYIPRPGAKLEIIFGEPVSSSAILEALAQKEHLSQVRSNVTSIVQQAVEALGRSKS